MSERPDGEDRLSIPIPFEEAVKASLSAKPITDPERFFAERGFRLEFSREATTVWAHLASAKRDFRVPKYGSGSDETSAAASALERWRVEQAT